MELGLFEIFICECSYCGSDLEPKQRCCNEKDCSCQFNFCDKECLDKFNEENMTNIG